MKKLLLLFAVTLSVACMNEDDKIIGPIGMSGDDMVGYILDRPNFHTDRTPEELEEIREENKIPEGGDFSWHESYIEDGRLLIVEMSASTSEEDNMVYSHGKHIETEKQSPRDFYQPYIRKYQETWGEGERISEKSEYYMALRWRAYKEINGAIYVIYVEYLRGSGKIHSSTWTTVEVYLSSHDWHDWSEYK